MSSRAAPAKTPSSKTAAAKAATKAAPAAKATPAAKAVPAVKAAAKAAAKAAPAAEPEEPAAAPVDEPPAADVAESAGEEHADAGKKTRVQLAHILAIDVSQARCATHLKSNLGDEAVEGEIKALRASLKEAKEAGDEDAISAFKAQIAEKSKALVRISGDTPIAVAVIWDSAIKELIAHGMDQAIAADRKIVETAHLHDGEPSALLYHPLYSKCASWDLYDQEHEEGLKQERAATNKAAKEAREAKKAADEKGGKGAKGAKGAKAAKTPVDEDEPTTNKTTFYTYVENALKTVKKEEGYKSMRVSNRVREYLSELVAEGIARQALLACIIVQRVVRVRTMNADHVKAVVHMLMADDGRTPEQIDGVSGQIDEKLALYHEHLSAEKTKKVAALDDDRKDALELKQREADLNRKRKQADSAKKRAIELAQKAKELSAETSALEPLVAAGKAAAEKAAVVAVAV